jgi:Protein of unknown function (DUF3224)
MSPGSFGSAGVANRQARSGRPRYGRRMRAEGTFSVVRFTPTDVTPDPAVETALPVGVATMEKRYEGAIAGRSATIFTSAFDPATGLGTYVALESFDGSVAGRQGTFNFVHSATTSGGDPSDTFFLVVPNSGTGALAGITGTGALGIDTDGTHRFWLEYELP